MMHSQRPGYPVMKVVRVRDGTYSAEDVDPPAFDPERGTYDPNPALLCWHCCHNFEGRGIPMPLVHDLRTDVFTVSGVFCSFPCIQAYNKWSGKTTRLTHGQGLCLFEFEKRMTKKTRPEFKCAPPRALLAAFGGYMSIDQFRKKSDDFVYDVLPVKCILHQQIVHEKRNSTLHQANPFRQTAQAAVQQQPVSQAEQLKIKKNKGGAQDPALTNVTKKPKKKQATLLEQTLGLA